MDIREGQEWGPKERCPRTIRAIALKDRSGMYVRGKYNSEIIVNRNDFNRGDVGMRLIADINEL